MIQKYWYAAFELKGFTIIDLRSAEVFALGHYPNALNASSLSEAHELIKAASPQKSILLVDYSPLRQAHRLWDFWQARKSIFVFSKGFAGLRKALNSTFHVPRNYFTLGGKTGAGKTKLLQELRAQRIQIIDLEHLAQSKGSVFEARKQNISQLQFELNLALALSQLNPQKPCILEREGRQIGAVFLPMPFYQLLQQAPCFWLTKSKEQRLQQILKDYANLKPTQVEQGLAKLGASLTPDAILRLEKLLKNPPNKTAIAEILLDYYDNQPGYKRPENVVAEIEVKNLKQAGKIVKQGILSGVEN